MSRLTTSSTLCFKLLSVALLGNCTTAAFSQGLQALQEVQVSAVREQESSAFSVNASKFELTGESLEQSNLQTLSDASQRVPGFYGFGTTPRLAGFSVRGLGNNQFNDGLDSSVGLYQDGVYLGRQSYGAFGLFDLEDVTVLRGPQGARYGLGSTAGEVQLRTRAPSHISENKVGLSVGNYGYLQTDASINGSILPGELAGRLSLYSQYREGLINNRFDSSQFNDQNRQGIRGQLLWTPADDWVVRLIGEYGVMDQRCCAIGLLAPVSPGIQASDEYMGYQRVGTNPFDREVDNNISPHSKITKESATLVAEWGPVGRHRFVSITGVSQLAFDPARNDDGTSMNLLEGSTTTRSRQLTQELRWHSQFKRLDTTLGVFLMNENLQGRELGILGDEIALWAVGGVLRRQVPGLNRQNSGLLINAVLPPQALNGLQLITPYRQETNTVSLFANADLHTSLNTTLSSGLRYNTSRRTASISRSRSGGNLDSSPLSLTNNLAALGALLGQDASAITYDGLIDSLVGESFDRSDTRKDSGLSGQLSLRHKFDSTLTGHASLTRGYKSGGLNLAGLSPRVESQFKAEIADSLEFGIRKVQPEKQIITNATIYNAKVRNFQALTYDEGDGLVASPRQNNVLNIPEVRLQGVEFDIAFPVSRSLFMGLGFAYNRAISTRFPNAPNEDTRRNDKNLSGKQLYNAPRWSGFATLEKRFAQRGFLEPYLGVDHTFRSSAFGTVDQSRSSLIDEYQLTNLRIGLRDLKNHWNLQAWVKNVFNEDYIAAVSALYSLGEYGGYAGDPLTYGLSLDVSFGK